MAQKLIDSLTADFDPSQYRDEYREELLAMIERKAEGKEIVQAETEEPEPTKAPDLMAALEQSIAAVRGREGGGKKPSRSKSKAKSSSNGSRTSKAKSSSKPKSSAKSKPKSKARS